MVIVYICLLTNSMTTCRPASVLLLIYGPGEEITADGPGKKTPVDSPGEEIAANSQGEETAADSPGKETAVDIPGEETAADSLSASKDQQKEQEEVGNAICAGLGGSYVPGSKGPWPCSADIPIVDQTNCTSTGGKFGEFCLLDQSKCLKDALPVCFYPVPGEKVTPAAEKAFQEIYTLFENKDFTRRRRMRRRRMRRRMRRMRRRM